MCTINSSGVPQLRLALDHCRCGKFVGPDCPDNDVPVAAVLGQEHHARGDAWVDLKANTKRAGCLTTGAAAARAEGGLGKAGVSISVRNSTAHPKIHLVG